MFEVDKNKVNSAKVRYRGVDRLIVNVLNNLFLRKKRWSQGFIIAKMMMKKI